MTTSILKVSILFAVTTLLVACGGNETNRKRVTRGNSARTNTTNVQPNGTIGVNPSQDQFKGIMFDDNNNYDFQGGIEAIVRSEFPNDTLGFVDGRYNSQNVLFNLNFGSDARYRLGQNNNDLFSTNASFDMIVFDDFYYQDPSLGWLYVQSQSVAQVETFNNALEIYVDVYGTAVEIIGQVSNNSGDFFGTLFVNNNPTAEVEFNVCRFMTCQ